jgi:uncharacterized membrane protein YedE/YeeE
MNNDVIVGLVGGLLIGLSSVGLMFYLGRIAGVSGILQASIWSDDRLWRVLFIVGLIAGSSVVYYLLPNHIHVRTDFPLSILALSGFIVGLGVAMGNGCTSGHGICGISRFSKRSIIATLAFFAFALITRYFVHTLFGVLP